MKPLRFDTENLLNLDNFSGIIPLFPLPNIVFFPNSLLPLHVFEPRYRQMVEDIIDSERIIGMVLLKPGWEKNYHDSPEIFSVGCMGRIISIEAEKEGRSNIVLYGLKRVRILEILHYAPYRLARVNLMEDIHGTNEEGYQKRISDLISRWNSMLGKDYKSHRINVDFNLALGTLTDSITPQIVSNVFHMQEFLEEANVLKRADKILGHLETKLEIISITSKRRNSILEKRNLN
jgi:ATP-dependent Lon protease